MAALILVGFGIGHTLPLAAAVIVTASSAIRRFSFPADVTATVSGTLMVMVGGLYVLIA
jgi:hypothetical protein